MKKKFNYNSFLNTTVDFLKTSAGRLSYTSNKIVVDNIREVAINYIVKANKKIDFVQPFDSKENNIKKRFLYAELSSLSKGDSLSLITLMVFHGFPIRGLPMAHVAPYLTHDIMQLVYGIYAGLNNKDIIEIYKEADIHGEKIIKQFNPTWWTYVYRSDSSNHHLNFIINLLKWNIDLESLPNQKNMKAWIKRNIKYNNKLNIESLKNYPQYNFIKELMM
jgi:hypothetical protein